MPRYTREISRSFDCGPAPHLDIRTVNGSIRVHGEERGTVQVTARVRFYAEHDDEGDAVLQAVEAGMQADGDRLTIRAPGIKGNSFFGSLFGSRRRIELDIAVVAPRACSLALHHSNGHVDLHQIGGDVRVHMVNGRFDATDLGGELSVHQVNGRCTVARVAGKIGMHHTNGAMAIEEGSGDIDLRLVNGSVNVLNPGGAVTIKGVSGAYCFRGAVRGDVSIDNAHGGITLEVPRDSRFHLDARSATGSVASELEVRSGDDVATAGDTGSRVRLRSETGRIELRAAQLTAA